MSLDGTTILYGLIAVNIAIYAVAIVGWARTRLRRIPNVSNIREALAILENSLRESFPDLPEGFTWQEVVIRLKAIGVPMDWVEIENILRRYEEYRFGRNESAIRDVDPKSVLKLAFSLPKGETFAPRSEEESA